jgi:hypothetical protein
MTVLSIKHRLCRRELWTSDSDVALEDVAIGRGARTRR